MTSRRLLREFALNDDRQKLIVEIAGLAGLVSTYPPQFQAHIQDMARDLVADPEFYDYLCNLLTSNAIRSGLSAIRSDGKNWRLQEPAGLFSKS